MRYHQLPQHNHYTRIDGGKNPTLGLDPHVGILFVTEYLKIARQPGPKKIDRIFKYFYLCVIYLCVLGGISAECHSVRLYAPVLLSKQSS